MVEIFENRQRLLHDLVRPIAFDVDDKTDAEGVVLESGIIKPQNGW
jgi:hypothetical protein